MVVCTGSPWRSALMTGPVETTTSMITNPIFLVGCVRSGTTLLRLMLDHHPDIAFDHEFEYAIDLIRPDGRYPSLDKFYSYLELHRIFLDSGRTIDRGLDFPELVDSFLRQKRDEAGKELVGATIHYSYERVLNIWPDARFIHIVRDGRDVSLSIEAYGWTGNAYSASDWWIEAERSWDNLCRDVPADRRVEVRFEELIEKPEEALTTICDFLGLDYSPEMLTYPLHSTYAPPSRRRVERWRASDPETIALIESRAGAMLAKRKYEASGLPLPTITRGEHRALIRRSRIEHARRRLKDRGAILFLADLISRRLNLPRLRRWVTQRLHALERSQLQ